MPAPPVWLQEWAFIVTPILGLVMIPALRALIVEPIRKMNEEHRTDHALLEYHFEVNGADKELAEEDRGMPLRTLVIRTRAELTKHLHESEPLMQQYRHDLDMRGEGGVRKEIA